MKKQIILLAASLLFFTATMFANQGPNGATRLIVSVVKAADAAALDLRLANLEKKGALLLLQDTKGNTWYSQHVWRKNGFAKRLNMKGMPDGTYTLSVSHQGATVIQALRLSKGVLEVLEHQKMEVPAPPGEDLVRRN